VKIEVKGKGKSILDDEDEDEDDDGLFSEMKQKFKDKKIGLNIYIFLN
jgi:hypothetical protein